jgi:CheY-like chemotaxis protein
MKLHTLAIAIIIVCLFFVVQGCGAYPAGDYSKVFILHLNFSNGIVNEQSVEMQYGDPPTLGFQAGDIHGSLKTAGGAVLQEFDLSDPRYQLSEEGRQVYSNNADFTLVVPYYPGEMTLDLTDKKTGALLKSVNFFNAINQFRLIYPGDPDMATANPTVPSPNAVLPASQAGATDSRLPLVLATLFSVSVFLAAGMAIWVIRRRTGVQTPDKQVVLIVDDDPLVVNLIGTLLDKKGYATLKASGGKECLDILKTRIADMILLDVVMEPMDGWQTLEQIKKNPDTGSIPVLMITGKKLTASDVKKYNLQIDDYIMKPFLPADLYAAVDKIRERKQKLNETLLLAKKAGIDKEMLYECSMLSGRISINRKILDILDVPRAVPQLTDLDTLDDMLVVDYINVKTGLHEKRVEQLRQEIKKAFTSKGLREPGR